MNDSSTGGFLSPVQPTPPIEDSALETFLQTMIAGITGLAADMVQPYPQTTTSPPPATDVDWCSFIVTGFTQDANAALVHQSANDGSDTYTRHEDIDIACRFYGAHAGQNAGVLRDGLYVPQNREQLQLNDFALLNVSGYVAAHDLLDQQVRRRFDITVRLRRKVTRTYRVLNLNSAQTSVFMG